MAELKLFLSLPLGLIVPFFLAQLMRNRYWLVTYCILMGILFFYVYYDYASASTDNVFDDLFAQILIYVVFLSIIIGIITKSYTLVLKSRKTTYLKRIMVTVIGFFLIIPVGLLPVFFSTLLLQWESRPLSPECRNDTAHLRMQDIHLNLATVPALSFSTDDGNHKKNDFRHYYSFSDFLGQKHIRKFCNDTNNGSNRINASSVSVFFYSLPSTINSPRYKNICSNKDAIWPKELCEHKYSDLHYPQDVHLYVDALLSR